MKSLIDQELKAIKTVARVMEGLSPASRDRVMAYMSSVAAAADEAPVETSGGSVAAFDEDVSFDAPPATNGAADEHVPSGRDFS